jgi:hypothetical protein
MEAVWNYDRSKNSVILRFHRRHTHQFGRKACRAHQHRNPCLVLLILREVERRSDGFATEPRQEAIHGREATFGSAAASMLLRVSSKSDGGVKPIETMDPEGRGVWALLELVP